MPDDLKGYRVFIASPGGLSDVRKSFREVIVECNEGDAIHRGAVFIPVGWEDTLPGMGRALCLSMRMIASVITSCSSFGIGGAPRQTTKVTTHKEEKEPADQPNSLLDKAEQLAQGGRPTEAETAFAALVVRGNDPDAFSRYGKFLWRLGRLDHAEVMFRRVIELSEQSGDNAGVAKGNGNLGSRENQNVRPRCCDA